MFFLKQTLSNTLSFYNRMTLFKVKILLWLTILSANPVLGSTLTVELGQSLPALKNLLGELQISPDSSFMNIILTRELSSTRSLEWEAPSEGVYHWRVVAALKSSQVANPSGEGMIQGIERSTSASGTFGVLAAKGQRPDPVQLKWSRLVGDSSDHYRVHLNAKSTKATYNAMRSDFTFRRLAEPFVVTVSQGSKSQTRLKKKNIRAAPEVISRLDTGFIFPHLSKTVSAQPLTGVEESKFVQVVDDQPAVPATPSAPAAVTAPEVTPPVAAKTIPEKEAVMPSEERFETRFSEAYVDFFGGVEKIYGVRSGPFTRSKDTVFGGGANIRVWPVPGFSISGRLLGGSGQRELGFYEADDQGASQSRSTHLSTGMMDFGLGVDLFFFNPNRRHQLMVEVKGGIVKSANLPAEVQDDTRPTLVDLNSQVMGLSAEYRWNLKRWHLGMSGATFVQAADRSENRDTTVDELQGFAGFDSSEIMSIRLGYLSRLTRVLRCSVVKQTCKDLGKSVSRFNLQGLSVGVGYVVR